MFRPGTLIYPGPTSTVDVNEKSIKNIFINIWESKVERQLYRMSQNSGTPRNTQHPDARRHWTVIYRFGSRGFVLDILTVEHQRCNLKPNQLRADSKYRLTHTVQPTALTHFHGFTQCGRLYCMRAWVCIYAFLLRLRVEVQWCALSWVSFKLRVPEVPPQTFNR